MERRHMSDRQFQTLYDHHLPGLYRAALFLVGEQKIAEEAAKEAFLRTALNRDFASDERVFAVESAKLLYALCKCASVQTYCLHPGFAHMAFPVEPAEMTVGQRAVVAFSALGLREETLVLVVGLSRFAVRQYLSRFVPRSEKLEQCSAQRFFSFTSL